MSLRESYVYLFLQITNIFVGLFQTLYIARNVDDYTYSIFVIYTLIITIFVTFTYLGYETVLIRNVLYWKEIKQDKKIINHISYAFFSRIVASSIIAIPVLLYIYYINKKSFNNENFFVFSSFIIAGFFASLANSNSLILKAFNRYALSFSIMLLSSISSRLIAIYIFSIFGFNAFIFILTIAPVVPFVISFLYLRRFISLKQIKFRYLFKFKRYRYFIFSGHLNYFKNSIDQFLISLMLSADILAVYSLGKKIEEVGRSIIEGMFDPIIQKIVKYKNINYLKNFIEYEKKLRLLRGFFLIITIVFVIIFDYFVKDVIQIAKLEHYSKLEYYLIFSSWVPVIYLAHKIESDIIYLFERSKILFYTDLAIGFVATSLAGIFFSFSKMEYLYLNRVILGILQWSFFRYYYISFRKSIFIWRY